MTAQSSLEQHGTFAEHPFAELMAEILQSRLSGALRIAAGGQKTIIYFHAGSVVYAVSNSKANRLFSCLNRRGKLESNALAGFRNLANDLELSAFLVANRLLTKPQIDEECSLQMIGILVDVLTWPNGEWTFDPKVQARRDLNYAIDAHQVLVDYARCVSADHLMKRFRSVQETFTPAGNNKHLNFALTGPEAEVFGKFGDRPLTIEELRATCTLTDTALLQAIYVLWLAGILVRHYWNSAFTAARVAEMHNSRLARVKAAIDAPTAEEPKQAPVDAPVASRNEKPATPLPEVELSLEEYLLRVEGAETHYDVLGVEVEAENVLIKHNYFSLAKRFHPDLYNREAPDLLKRIQSAFTVVAHAHETLRSPEAREAYNSKMYREIEKREKRKAEGVSETAMLGAEHGLESFEEGLKMLGEEEYELAAGYLARAVHYRPQNALYHAYYGQALSGCGDKNRHKAESELQTAVKLEPGNAKIRMMLVEFLVAQKMLKRAEGELRRFLEIAPGNKEATEMLAKLA